MQHLVFNLGTVAKNSENRFLGGKLNADFQISAVEYH